MQLQDEWKQITYDEWVRDYEPTTDEMQPLVIPDDQNRDYSYYWTVLDCDEEQIISSGWHYVNRIGFYITKKPHNFMVDVVDE